MRTAAMCILISALCTGPARPAEPVPAGDEKTAELDVNNPVRKISEMMKKAASLLEKFETGSPTQEEQKKILEELDRLIEMAQQSSSSSSQQQQQEQKPGDPRNSSEPRNTGGSASSPVTDERDILRQVSPGVGAGAPDLREMWGKLPDAQRDEVLQLLREKLPLKYKQLLIWYFKALSEKK